MKFTVEWSPVAEQRLAELWNSALDRKELTDAANAIDQALAQDPKLLNGGRPDGTCSFFMPPVGVLFHIDEFNHVVRVLKVWAFKKRR
jgi:plasmid stabilization system protein ParE